ncbi:hypothetical protein ACIGB8_23685 [Promicromonospora sukumoe]|uniref:hypothetical protein n=1 Tax=Promicromonospora sukumoe TaxID=88382 RepID=UPI0037C5F5E3
MRSQVLEDATARPVPVRARELLVLWQHPATRQIMPVGRLEHDGATYSFDYTVAAGSITGFRELLGLGHLGEHFESQSLPTLLHQRVMDSDRPDFETYIASLGLNPETVTPWEQIVESGGQRAGDTLQFVEIPQIVQGRANARFFANGVRHIPGKTRSFGGRMVTVTEPELENAFRELGVGDQVEIFAENGNPVDEDAALVARSGIPLGWVPRFLAPGVRRLLAHNRVFARVVRVNGPSTPPHLRLVLELDTPAPATFSFDPNGDWEPLSR